MLQMQVSLLIHLVTPKRYLLQRDWLLQGRIETLTTTHNLSSKFPFGLTNFVLCKKSELAEGEHANSRNTQKGPMVKGWTCDLLAVRRPRQWNAVTPWHLPLRTWMHKGRCHLFFFFALRTFRDFKRLLVLIETINCNNCNWWSQLQDQCRGLQLDGHQHEWDVEAEEIKAACVWGAGLLGVALLLKRQRRDRQSIVVNAHDKLGRESKRPL